MQKSIYTGGRERWRGGAIFREHENRTLAPCAVPSIYMIYVYTAVSRARVPRARVCVHAHARLLHGRYTHTLTHTYGRTCARDIRGYQSYAKLQTETAPLSLSLQPPPSHPYFQRAKFAYIRRHTRPALISPATGGN